LIGLKFNVRIKRVTKKQRKKESKKKELEETLNQIKQKFGEGAIMKLKEARPVDVDVIPTGSIALDFALGVGGIPRGRVIEIFGPAMSGKTTLALHILAEVQKKGGVAAFVDAEHALDPDYANRIGVNVQELLISQPDSGEQALQIVESLVKSGQFLTPLKPFGAGNIIYLQVLPSGRRISKYSR